MANLAENFCLYQDTNVVAWKITYFVYFKVFL